MNEWYSVLIYQKRISELTYDKICKYITKGIKVYFLTESNFIEIEDYVTVSQNDNVLFWRKKGILSVNEKIYLSVDEDFVVKDGQLPDEIKEELQQDGKFNLEQYCIEHAREKNHIIVTAGAGTGKTKTMIDRVLFLVMNGHAKFQEIVMITFTNKAANEMKRKLAERLETYFEIVDKEYKVKFLDWLDELTQMHIQTIHSFIKYMVECFGERLGIDRDYMIKNLEYEKRNILEELINEYRFNHYEEYKTFRFVPQYKIVDAIIAINRYCLSRGVDVSDNKLHIDWGENESCFHEFMQYLIIGMNKRIREYKEENRLLELSDLVSCLYSFMTDESEYEAQFIKYLFVDEFQDTDYIQIQYIVWLIKKFACKIFVVGDTKQGIYRFRGATDTAFTELIDSLEKEVLLENVSDFTLRKNYRSNENLIDIFNEFFYQIANGGLYSGYEKQFEFNNRDRLEAAIKEKSIRPIGFFEQGTDKQDKAYIECVQHLINQNKEIAVLVRTNKELETVVQELEQAGIVCNTEVSGNFYRCLAVREFYIVICALIYPKVWLNQYAFVNSSYGEGINNSEILESVDSRKNNYLRALLTTSDSYVKLQKYREMLKTNNYVKVLHDLVEDFKPHIQYGMREYQKAQWSHLNDRSQKITTKVINYKMNLEQLFSIIDLKLSDKGMSLLEFEEFLRVMIQTNTSVDEKRLNDTGHEYDVTCMTVHKAKGLEFGNVVLPVTTHSFINHNMEFTVIMDKLDIDNIRIGYKVNIDDQILQNDNYTKLRKREEEEVIAEEIRLLYVALTRAKESVYISKNKLVNNSGKIQNWMQLIERGGLQGEELYSEYIC